MESQVGLRRRIIMLRIVSRKEKVSDERKTSKKEENRMVVNEVEGRRKEKEDEREQKRKTRKYGRNMKVKIIE